jgi:hypothetical protein
VVAYHKGDGDQDRVSLAASSAAALLTLTVNCQERLCLACRARDLRQQNTKIYGAACRITDK